jgi:diguanylate cyclase (GGDEF)-like protein
MLTSGTILEPGHLQKLREAGPLTGDGDLDRIARLAARLLRAPSALVSFLDEDGEIFAARAGTLAPPAPALPFSRSPGRQVVQAGEALACDDAGDLADLVIAALITDLGWSAYAAVPIYVGEAGPVGVLAVCDPQPRSWSPDDIVMLSELAAVISADLRRRAAGAAGARALDTLRRLSLIDDLTGLYNRRAFMAIARKHFKLAHRMGRDLLLIFADIDDLEHVNAREGRGAGDAVLLQAAGMLQETFRESDIIARIGGDEFAVLAIEGERDGEDVIVSRLNAELAGLQTRAGREVTVSLGIARYDPEHPSSILELLISADAAINAHRQQRRTAAPLDRSPPGDHT